MTALPRAGLGHGPAHLLVESAAEIGFQWDSRVLGWVRPGLPVRGNLAGPIQTFQGCGIGGLEEYSICRLVC